MKQKKIDLILSTIRKATRKVYDPFQKTYRVEGEPIDPYKQIRINNQIKENEK